jgi:hypothetical protein
MAVLWSSDFAAASPYGFNGDFGAAGEGTLFTRAAFATGGPGNRPYATIDFIPVGVHSQPYSGWEATSIGGVPSQGAARYVRYRMWVNSGFNATGNNGPWGNKAWMIGDGGVGGNRIIALERVRTGDTDFNINVEKGIDNLMPYQLVSQGSWHSFQCEVQSSSTGVATDGWIKLWYDNDTYGSPSKENLNLALPVTDWNNFRFGSFFNETTVASGGSVGLRFAQVEYADTFDSSYHANLNSGGGGGSAIAFGIGIGEF